jgi:hypothetical protein
VAKQHDYSEKGLQKERREMAMERKCQNGARQRQLEVHPIGSARGGGQSTLGGLTRIQVRRGL